jgi:RHS repeat-associated protein
LGWTQLLNFDTSRTTRGYTGHEGLDPVGLIHMNGRVYDPKLGRFISADPHVQAPGNTQNLNRYSYVLNNPLSYTDPSGYFFKKLKQFAGIIIGAVVAVACSVCFAGAWGILTGAAIGGASGWIATGSVKGAFMGAVSGAIFGGVGGYFADAGTSVFSSSGFLAFGAAGGITEVLNGGNFGHGFLTAGVGALVGASPTLQGAHPGLQVGSKAIVGGTLSAATGGKFANGAYSAAMAAIVHNAAARGAAQLKNYLKPAYAHIGEMHSLSAEEAQLIHEKVMGLLAEMGETGLENVSFVNKYARVSRDGRVILYETYEEYLAGHRQGNWLGGFRQGKPITVFRNAYATEITEILLGNPAHKLNYFPRNFAPGVEGGLFTIGHELGHRTSGGGGFRWQEEVAANRNGDRILQQYRERAQ